MESGGGGELGGFVGAFIGVFTRTFAIVFTRAIGRLYIGLDRGLHPTIKILSPMIFSFVLMSFGVCWPMFDLLRPNTPSNKYAAQLPS